MLFWMNTSDMNLADSIRIDNEDAPLCAIHLTRDGHKGQLNIEHGMTYKNILINNKWFFFFLARHSLAIQSNRLPTALHADTRK